MTRGGPGCAGSHRTPLVFRSRARERLIDTWLDVAFGLATDGGQFRNYEITRPFEHALFAKREWFDLAQIGQMLEDISYLEDVAGTHFF